MAVTETEVVAPETSQNKTRRNYSDDQKARALALYDLCGSLTETSRKSGIPDATLSCWIRGQRDRGNKNTEKLRNQYGQDLASQFEEIAHDVARVAKTKLQRRDASRIPFGQLMEGGSKAVQNMQLLRGQPTSIHEEISINSHQVLVILQESLGTEPKALPPVTNSQPTT